MKALIIPIGNSKGIRIPKTIIQQCHLTNEVDLEVKGETIILKSVKKRPRQGWDAAFKTMHENKEDQPIIADTMDFKDWQW